MSQQATAPYRFEQILGHTPGNWLQGFSKNVASQAGEDGIIQKIFEILQPTNRYCVEFGAWDGRHLSNCFNLIDTEQWSACFIEANAGKFQDLLRNHGSNDKVACVNQYVEFEGENSLDSILHAVGAPQNPDLISIDVDGIDWFIWESLTIHRPNVVVIEFNPTIPNDDIFIQAKDPAVNHGCSLRALVELGKQKGYELVACTAYNAFFIKAESFALFGIADNHINLMYRPVMDGRIFHGYDSEIFVCGMPHLIWSDLAVDPDKLQLIPRHLRRFPDAQ
jgi:hypothetical protein